MAKKLILLLVLAIFVTGIWAWKAQTPENRPDFPHSDLDITRADGRVFHFDVEVARTGTEQAYGLMFVRSMPFRTGMIFPYNPPAETAFWMKNTLIPLDMLFIRPDHTIGRIVANAVPGDMSPITSNGVISAVIEINGGEARTDGLAVGDKVTSADIAPAP